MMDVIQTLQTLVQPSGNRVHLQHPYGDGGGGNLPDICSVLWVESSDLRPHGSGSLEVSTPRAHICIHTSPPYH